MSRGENPFITYDNTPANMPKTFVEAHLIRMLPYVNYRTSDDPRVQKGSWSHQEGCCNIKSHGRICLQSLQQKSWPENVARYVNHARIRSTLLRAALSPLNFPL